MYDYEETSSAFIAIKEKIDKKNIYNTEWKRMIVWLTSSLFFFMVFFNESFDIQIFCVCTAYRKHICIIVQSQAFRSPFSIFFYWKFDNIFCFLNFSCAFDITRIIKNHLQNQSNEIVLMHLNFCFSFVWIIFLFIFVIINEINVITLIKMKSNNNNKQFRNEYIVLNKG